MTLKDELDDVVAKAISDMGEMRAELTALEHSMPAACGRTMKVRQIMMTLATRLTGIKVLAAKEVMVGNEAPATRQEQTGEYELFANSSPGGGIVEPGAKKACFLVEGLDQGGRCPTAPRIPNTLKREQHTLLLESLHRAGDHTLDDEEGKA